MARTFAVLVLLGLSCLSGPVLANLPRYSTCHGFVCVSSYVRPTEWKEQLFYQRENGDRLWVIRLKDGASFRVLLHPRPGSCPKGSTRAYSSKERTTSITSHDCISIVVAGRDSAFDASLEFRGNASSPARSQLDRFGPALRLEHQYGANGLPLPPRRDDDPPSASPPLVFGS
jgi:hypothetical protein